MPVSGAAGPQGHQHLLASVQAHTLGADGILESALSEHLKLSPAAPSNGARVAPPCPVRTRRHRGAVAHSDTRIWRHRAPQKGRYRNTIALFSLRRQSRLAPQKGRNIQHILGFSGSPAIHLPRLADAALPACPARRSQPRSTGGAAPRASAGSAGLAAAGGAALDKVGTSRP